MKDNPKIAVLYIVLIVGLITTAILDAVIPSEGIKEPPCTKEGGPMPYQYCDEKGVLK